MIKTIIEPKKDKYRVDFKELYAYRELLFTLAYRDFKVKYAQTLIGFLWAVINPLFTLAILAFVFGTVAKVQDQPGSAIQAPYLIYTIAGMCGWQYFATVLADAGNSIIGAQQMVKKIYFPRLVIPMSKAITAFIDFAMVILIMIALMVYYQYVPSSNIIYFPFFFLVAVLSGLAGGLWMSALTIRFRDFQHITPMLLRLGMYATPIAYPASAVPDKYLWLFYLNPMAGVVEGMRWCIIGGEPLSSYIYLSFAGIFLLFILGIFYFKSVERVMADIL